MRLMWTGAKLRAELSVSLPAELKTGETETTGCICCGLLFVLPADIFCGFAVVFWRKYGILYIQLATCNLTHFVLYCIFERRDFFRGASLWLCKVYTASFFCKNCRQKFSQQYKIPGHPSAVHRRQKNPIKICTIPKIWYTIYVSEKDSSFRYVRRIRRRNSFLSTCVPRL